MNQLGEQSDQFNYSKDLFNEDYNDFVFYAFNDGFGFITDSSKIVYGNIGDKILFKDGNFDQDLINGKAYLQVLSNDYLNR